jgi:phosphotransferase system HPr-like phosphotransfer protein
MSIREFKVVMGTTDKAIQFVDIVSKFNENVDLVRGRYCIDAKSLMGVLTMDLDVPMTLKVNASDKRFQEICHALKAYAA